MKITKIFWGLASIIFVSALSFAVVGCKNNDDDESKSENVNEVSDDINDEAFSIIRGLCDLTTISSENSIKDEDDNIVGGIEEVPDNWQEMTFTPDVGYQLDEEKNPTVWSYPVASTEAAAEWFFDLIGEVFEDESYPASSSWNIKGLGTLTYKAVSGDANLYATVDVDISVIPELKQIRFVPSSVIAAANPANSYSGLTYFTGGDVIRRKKDNTLWMCVRPAGGPLKKDKSYWICLNPGNAPKLIKSETKNYTLPYDVKNEAGAKKKNVEWTYAKGLMSLKTAKAAFHTFTLLSGLTENNVQDFSYCNTELLRNQLESKTNYKLSVLRLNNFVKTAGNPEEADFTKRLWSSHPECRAEYCFAYENPKKDSQRNYSVTDATVKRTFPKVAGVTYVQPYIYCGIGLNPNIEERINTGVANQYKYSTKGNGRKLILYSATDNFDEAFLKCYNDTASYWGKPFSYDDTENYDITQDADGEAWNEDKWFYDYRNFLHRIDDNNTLCYVNPCRTYACANVGKRDHVIFSPELMIKDNSGTAEAAKSPVKEHDFEIVIRYGGGDSNVDGYDWWKTFDVITRKVDLKKVDWNKENK